MKYTHVITLSAVLLITACTTQHYGRLQPVSPGEERNMNCQEIQLEITRAQAFINQTKQHNDKLTTEDFTGIFASLGIGNILEYHDAMHAAKVRLNGRKKRQAISCDSQGDFCPTKSFPNILPRRLHCPSISCFSWSRARYRLVRSISRAHATLYACGGALLRAEIGMTNEALEGE